MFKYYSYRSASTGSNRAALLAGQIPKNNPIPTDTTIPNPVAHNGTMVGRFGNAKCVPLGANT